MKKWKKRLIAVLSILAVTAVILALKTLRDAGEFKKLSAHSDCACTAVSGVPGPEDIAIDNSTGTAFISSFDRRAAMAGTIRPGAIFVYNLEGRPRLKNLTEGLAIRLNPHGISFYRAPDGKKYLFAINHQIAEQLVEIFEYDGNALVHRETVRGGAIISPNDIAAVGPRRFYFTNDHGSTSRLGKLIEDYLQLSRANITYYDGKSFRIVADGLAYANGIWADGGGRLVYATSTVGRKFHVYNRDPASGSLRRESELDLSTGADNIDVDQDGMIWVAAHPRLLTFMKHASDKTKKSPSQVLEIYWTGSGYAFKEVYLDRGEEISGASVAAVYKNRMLLGAVFGNFFLDCTMKRRR